MDIGEILAEGGEVAIFFDPGFPAEDLFQIANELAPHSALVPGFVPPEVGLLSPLALIQTHISNDVATVILPDRNIVTRMAKIAKNGMPEAAKTPDRVAAQLMAIAQTINLQIEPSIAFHELAHRKGNEFALDELEWFQRADQAQPLAWIDVALLRKRCIGTTESPPRPTSDLGREPINRIPKAALI